MENFYDIIIIGGGPGGYSAALYTARAGLSTLVLEATGAGGQMLKTMQIDNYPGFDETVAGYQLGQKMQSAAHKFGAKTEFGKVESVSLAGKIKKVVTAKKEYAARAVIIATGASHRYLGVEHEEKLVGKGVAYCAACDGMFYRGKTVAVVGGGNSAVADALVLSRVAQKVYLIHRRDTLRAEKIYHDAIEKAENVEFIPDSVVKELLHGEKLTGLRLENVKNGESRNLELDGVFISVGYKPNTELFADQLALENGYILADESTRTSLPGVFAVGDVRTKAVRQIVTAAADGAVASHFAQEYLAGEGN